MSKPVDETEVFLKLDVLEILAYLDEVYDNKVPQTEILSYYRGMSSHAIPLRDVMPDRSPLFLSMDEFSIKKTLDSLVNESCVRRRETSGKVYGYGITHTGIERIKASMGVGMSGGGEEHRIVVYHSSTQERKQGEEIHGEIQEVLFPC